MSGISFSKEEGDKGKPLSLLKKNILNLFFFLFSLTANVRNVAPTPLVLLGDLCCVFSVCPFLGKFYHLPEAHDAKLLSKLATHVANVDGITIASVR